VRSGTDTQAPIFLKGVCGMSQIVMLSVDQKNLTSDLERAGFKKMGILVRSASSYPDIIKALKLEKIDIIVVNMDHTGMDPLDAVKKLKESPAWGDLPIVLTSVQSSAKIKELAKKSGADLFVEQPLPRDYFIEKLKSLLSHQTRSHGRVSGSVTVRFSWHGESHSVEVGDLSLTGVLLTSTLVMPAGDLLDLEISIGASNKPVKVKGEVVRIVQPDSKRIGAEEGGIGVRFNQFSADGQQRIESWVARTSDSTNKMAYYL
jgi:CheY-like chemotaxis protein